MAENTNTYLQQSTRKYYIEKIGTYLFEKNGRINWDASKAVDRFDLEAAKEALHYVETGEYLNQVSLDGYTAERIATEFEGAEGVFPYVCIAEAQIGVLSGRCKTIKESIQMMIDSRKSDPTFKY